MIHFIVNPSSRSGKGRLLWESVSEKLTRSGVAFDVYFTKNHSETVQYVHSITRVPEQPWHHLAVLGGDGTMNEVADGIADRAGTCISYLPTGSGNDLARALGIRGDLNTLTDRLLAGPSPRRADVGESICTAEDGQTIARTFLISSGIGFDAAACEKSARSGNKAVLNRLGLGKLTYLTSSLSCLFHTPKGSCRLTAAEPAELFPGSSKGFLSTPPFSAGDTVSATYSDILFGVAMIHPYEGGGFPFCPMADADDGLFDLCFVHHVRAGRFLRLMPAAKAGKHLGSRHIISLRSPEITIETEKPLYVHTDGEVIGQFRRVTFRRPEDSKLTFLI